MAISFRFLKCPAVVIGRGGAEPRDQRRHRENHGIAVNVSIRSVDDMSWANGAALALACAASACSLIAGVLSTNSVARQREVFWQWLTSKGAIVERLRISPSNVRSPYLIPHHHVWQQICDSNGVFLHPTSNQSWALRVMGEKISNTVASFPCDIVLTIETPFADPLIGRDLYEMYEEFNLSPAVVLALYILIHKKLKERSQWNEWIQMLPLRIQTPLTYPLSKLQELKGTSLMMAAEQMKDDMFACWENIERSLGSLFLKLGEVHDVRCHVYEKTCDRYIATMESEFDRFYVGDCGGLVKGNGDSACGGWRNGPVSWYHSRTGFLQSLFRSKLHVGISLFSGFLAQRAWMQLAGCLA